MIDVLIPAYNAERTIRSSVDSILKQTVQDLRVLVVDDGSVDRTSAILADIARSDQRLEVIRTENRGIVAALNTGLANCTAEIIARHDADDIAYPHRLARQQSYLEKHSDCVAVGASVYHIDEKGRRTGTVLYNGDAEGDPRRIPAGEPYLMHSFLMVRRSAVEQIGGYRHVFYAEDSDLYWRLEPFGRLYNLEDILGEVRVHAASLTSRTILNGRINAVSSQLAAISAVRRANGKSDLTFEESMLAKLEASESLRLMICCASTQLDPSEKVFLQIATCAKMLELRTYRRFKLSGADLHFITRVLLRYRGLLDAPTWKRVGRQILHLLRPKLGLRRVLYRLFRSPL